MAARKKGSKKKVTHRRRVSGMSAKTMDTVQMIIGAALGAAGGWYVYTTQKSIKDSLMGWLQIGAGGAAAFFVDMPLVKGLGMGLAGSGAIIEGESFGLLSGVTNLPSNNRQLAIAGFNNVHQLGATPGRSFPSPAMVGRVGLARKYGAMNR